MGSRMPVALADRGAIAVARVDQARKDALFLRVSPDGKKLGQPRGPSMHPT